MTRPASVPRPALRLAATLASVAVIALATRTWIEGATDLGATSELSRAGAAVAASNAPAEVGLAAEAQARAVEEEPAVALSQTPADGTTSTGDHPDPSLLITDAGAWAYSTNHGEMHVPVASVGPDGQLGAEHDALPVLPQWTIENSWFTWAPSVAQVGDGFNLYYAALDEASQAQCIGVATSAEPEGPFTDDSTQPLICPEAGRGAIDPSPVHADGRLWLVWKQERTSTSPNSIWVQELDSTGTELVGSATMLLAAEQSWEGGVVEAPSMTNVDGRWYLMYSGNDWTERGYATGLAACASITGPCLRVSPYAQVSGGTHQAGSGGAEFATDTDGGLWVIYHSWGDDGLTWDDGGERQANLARAEIADGRLTLNPIARS